jgi:parvulin-like peptidyl-prolyl isomerase
MILRLPAAAWGLAATGLLVGCASRSGGGRVVARSSLGTVTAAELDRFIATAGQAPDPSKPRARLEELLVRRALEHEAEQSGVLRDPQVAAELRRRSDALLVEQVRARLAAEPPPPVSDAQVDDAYAGSSLAAAPQERLRLRHIFKRLSRAADAGERARVEQEMEAVRAELDAGADFRALARTRSDSQTASFDGLVAPVARGDLDPALEAVLWRLAPGERTGIVRTSAGLQIFQLEERVTNPAVPVADGKRVIRTRLERAAQEEHARAQLTALAKAHGADVHTDALQDPDAADEEVAFELKGWRLTVGDLRRLWRARPFVARRTSTLRAVLEAEAADRLLLEQARREGLEAQPETRARLLALRRDYAAEVVAQRRAAALSASPDEAELQRLFQAERARFDAPEARRLRGIVVPLDDPRAANATYDSLDRLARRIRAGEEDLAAAARRLSRDPSRTDAGELGWAEAKDLAVWGGSSVSAGVFALAPGEISVPLLVEAYDDERLVYVPRAYLLARVEEIRSAGPPPYAQARPQVVRLYQTLHAAEIGRRVRDEMLASIGAVILERP